MAGGGRDVIVGTVGDALAPGSAAATSSMATRRGGVGDRGA